MGSNGVDLVFDRGDVQIWARSFDGIVSRILFVAIDRISPGTRTQSERTMYQFRIWVAIAESA
jgi:hypothetical protein